ncbi:MAG: TetR/AcrR family transcriptional regulator [Gemmatimonadales bacterium]
MSKKAEMTRDRILDAAEAEVMARGFAATSVDDIQSAAGISRGTFFYHFPSKDALARALIERYAAQDHELVESLMARAENLVGDPLQQALVFMGLFEELFREVGPVRAGCLFASYSYEAQLFDDETHRLIAGSLEHFRRVFGGKLEQAIALHPPRVPVDPYELADLASAAFQGAYVVWRVLGDEQPIALPLEHFRKYLELLFGLEQVAVRPEVAAHAGR